MLSAIWKNGMLLFGRLFYRLNYTSLSTDGGTRTRNSLVVLVCMLNASLKFERSYWLKNKSIITVWLTIDSNSSHKRTGSYYALCQLSYLPVIWRGRDSNPQLVRLMDFAIAEPNPFKELMKSKIHYRNICVKRKVIVSIGVEPIWPALWLQCITDLPTHGVSKFICPLSNSQWWVGHI